MLPPVRAALGVSIGCVWLRPDADTENARRVALAAHTDDPARRDFLMIAAGSFAAVGAAATLWPLIQQMNPDASTQALASIEVDLAPIREGQAITVMWRGKPVFIRNRTASEVKTATETPLGDLPDQSARNDALPERAA